jgi:hypothetical protein
MLFRNKNHHPTFFRSKTVGTRRDPHPERSFYRAVNEYRRRRKTFRHMRINDFQDYINDKDRKKSFKDFVDALEELRCSLGVVSDHFYALASEFTLQPNQLYYYNPTWLFAKGSFMSEEFQRRIFDTFPVISTAIGEDDYTEEVVELIAEINKLPVNVDVKSAGLKNSKDWYCIKAIRNIINDRGWTEEEFLSKVKKFYRSRVRKVYTEGLLMDVWHGLLDDVKEKEKKQRKPKHIAAMDTEPWAKEWAEGIPG